MKNNQAILINKLAHEAQNELTTMRLALFNLKHLLTTEEHALSDRKRSSEFFEVLDSSLNKSIDTISKILMVARTQEGYFKETNILSILYDLVTRHNEYHRIKIEHIDDDVLIETDSRAFQMFFETLLDTLLASMTSEEEPLSIRFTKSDRWGMVIQGNFQVSKLASLFSKEKTSERDGSVIPLLLHQMRSYLKLSLGLENTGNPEIRIRFNQ